MFRYWKPALLLILLACLMQVNEATFAAAATTCNVPSATYPSIQSAINDTACTQIQLADATFNENVTINRSVTVEGVTNTTGTTVYTFIKGQQLGSVFTIVGPNSDQAIEVTLRNLAAQEGQAINGGGINVTGNVNLTLETVFMNDHSAENGAGIYFNSPSILAISGGLIYHNNATVRGGAIHMVQGTANLGEFKMFGNTAQFGGGIALEDAILNVNGTEIQGNDATVHGGGVDIPSSDKTVAFSGAVVLGNGAPLGGGIYTERPIKIDASTVQWNTGTDGGGIYANNVNLDISRTNIIGNRISGNGGGIYMVSDEGVRPNNLKLTIQNSTIASNSTDTSGGGLYATGDIDTTLNGMDIYSNNARIDGHGIAAYGANAVVKVNDSALKSNRGAAGPTLQRGGAIAVRAIAELTISNSYFGSNLAEGGGAIYAEATNPVNVFNSSFFSNVAADRGGAAILAEQGLLVIDGVWFEGNWTRSVGGALNVNGALRMRNSTVYDNQAGTGGGASLTSGPVDIEAVAFDSNKAGAGAGLAIFVGPGSEIRNSSITNNVASVRGGGMLLTTQMTLRRVLVGDNSAVESGGGIEIQQTPSEFENPIEIVQSSIYRNSADIGGGIHHRRGLPLMLTNVTVSENSATTEGSAIYGASPIIAAYSTIAFNKEVGAVHKISAETPFIFQFSLIHNPDVDNCTGDISSIQLASTIDSDGTCSLTRNTLTGIDPMLAPLHDNGNDQMSHALLPDSPARNLGTNCPQFDQHGNGRPAASCDLGAFQTQLVPSAVSLSGQTAQTTNADLLVYALFFVLCVATVGWHRMVEAR